MKVDIDKAPNPCLTEVLMGSELRAACQLFATRAASLYQARVHKVSGELAAATTARTTVIRTRYGPRHAGEVVVDSPHFLPHEEGWTGEDGEHHEGAHDFNAVLAEMAGLPIPIGASAPAVAQINKLLRAPEQGPQETEHERGVRESAAADIRRRQREAIRRNRYR